MHFFVATLLAGTLLTLMSCAGPVEKGCEDTAGCDTAVSSVDTADTNDTASDTDTSYDGPTELSDIDWSCTAATFIFDVEVVGPSLGADLYITQNTASPWNEVHPIPTLEVDEDRYWSKLGLALEIIHPEYHNVVEGVSTGFSCSGDQGSMVFLIDLLDAYGAYVDCGVFGVDPNIFRNECDNIWN